MSHVATRASGRHAVADSGCQLYAIVRAGTRTPAEFDGAVELVRHGRVAALVRPDQRRPVRAARQDLLGYARLLDRLADTDPVLPVRFGTVLDSPAAVGAKVLAPHHDAYLAALNRLAGKAQFLLAARYMMDTILAEVLAEQPAIQRLRARVGESDPAGRVRLGELVARAVADKRAADTDLLATMLSPHTVAGRVLDVDRNGEEGVAELALLVEHRYRDSVETAAEQLARGWEGRVRLRLRGPMAAYHFVDALVGAEPERGPRWV
jgi:gas vesicle protein GvpL/GvpF